MTDRNEGPTKAIRRRILGAVGTGLVATLGGCADDLISDGEAEPTFAHPDTVTIDEPFSLEIEDLPPDTALEVTATVDDARGVTWSANATYEGTDGTLNLDDEEPVEAAYDEADTMRLIQHMRPEGEESRPYALPQKEWVTIEVAADGDAIGSTTIARTFGDPDMTATAVPHPDIVGEVFEPPGTDTAPGVVVLHGSEGQPRTDVARLLASNGFVALALQYFGGEGLPSELVEVPAELVDDAATWLLERDDVGGSQVGLIGVSRGGELALLAGSRFESVGTVVGINASGVAWQGATGTDGSPSSSWTVDGDPVPYVPYPEEPSLEETSDPIAIEPTFRAALEAASEDRIDEATFPVEEIDGPVLLVSGGDDRLWNSVELASIAVDRLESRDHSHEFDHVIFDGAGHAIWYPYLPTANREEIPPYVMGGSPAGYAEAEAAYWPRALETLGQS